MVWYSHLFQNFPQLIVIHTVKGFGIVNKAEIDVFTYYIIIACLLTCLPLSLDNRLHEGLYPYLLAQYVSVCSVAQLCPTLLDLMNCSLSGSSVHGISQARILEWVAISFSRDLPDPGIKPASLMSPAKAGGFFTTSTTWEAQLRR